MCLNRSTRESTPCSLIRDSSVIHTPGSTTRQRTRRIIHEHPQRNIPTSLEMDEFFALAEKQQQAIFMDKCVFLIFSSPSISFKRITILIYEKLKCVHCLFCRYNFDVVNDVPLPGRYEWVPVLH